MDQQPQSTPGGTNNNNMTSHHMSHARYVTGENIHGFRPQTWDKIRDLPEEERSSRIKQLLKWREKHLLKSLVPQDDRMMRDRNAGNSTGLYRNHQRKDDDIYGGYELSNSSNTSTTQIHLSTNHTNVISTNTPVLQVTGSNSTSTSSNHNTLSNGGTSSGSDSTSPTDSNRYGDSNGDSNDSPVESMPNKKLQKNDVVLSLATSLGLNNQVQLGHDTLQPRFIASVGLNKDTDEEVLYMQEQLTNRMKLRDPLAKVGIDANDSDFYTNRLKTLPCFTELHNTNVGDSDDTPETIESAQRKLLEGLYRYCMVCMSKGKSMSPYEVIKYVDKLCETHTLMEEYVYAELYEKSKSLQSMYTQTSTLKEPHPNPSSTDTQSNEEDIIILRQKTVLKQEVIEEDKRLLKHYVQTCLQEQNMEVPSDVQSDNRTSLQ